MDKPNKYRVWYENLVVGEGGIGFAPHYRDIQDLEELAKYNNEYNRIVSVYPIFLKVFNDPVPQEEIDAAIKDALDAARRKEKEVAVRDAEDVLQKAKAALSKE